MSDKKRLLVLTSTFPRWKGDCEPPFVFELSKRLSERFDVTVLAPHAPKAMLNEQVDGMDIRRFRYFFEACQQLAYDGGILAKLKKNYWNYLLIPFFIFSELAALIQLLRKSRFDVIHAHWLVPQGVVAIAATLLLGKDIPVICTSHGGDLFGLNGWLFRWLKRFVIKRASKVTVVSQAMKDYASSLSGRNDIKIIPMGADLLEQFLPPLGVANDALEILFAGRLVEKKGVRYLILAMPEILKRYPTAKLVIAGDGPERAELQQLAITTGIAPNVKFLGMVNHEALRELYRRAAVFVAPSIVAQNGDQEGLGLVLVEALGCGCAVVASDLPAIRDVVIDDITGRICRQRDSQDIADKVLFLFDHPAVAVELGRAGREHVVRHFDWRMVSCRYGDLIDAAA